MKKKSPATTPKKRGKAAARMRRRCVIPAGSASLDEVYDTLTRGLGLPAHFGRNLDALWDCLTRDVAGPFAIVVEDAAALERALGAPGRKLVALLKDVGRERQDASIVLRRRR